MAALLTKDKVLELAFTRNSVDVKRIPDKLIESIQYKHLVDILGEDFYDEIIDNKTSYSTLISYIEPYLAYLIKYYILPDIWIEISATGINKISGNNRITSNKEEYLELRQSSIDLANMHLDLLNKHLKDNGEDYSLYESGENKSIDINIKGGIIFENIINENEED